MEPVYVLLNTAEKVNDFVHAVEHLESEFDVNIGNIYIDGKSLLGLMALDRKQPLKVTVHIKEDYNTIARVFEPFIMN